MRKPVVAANWKMFKTRDEALQFIYAVNDAVPSKDIIETIICAPAIHLRSLVKRQGENIRIGAQNMHYADEGAYTGEISPNMLVSTGVTYVIIGHSERRIYNNETEEDVNLKLIAAINHGLIPIVCLGETEEQFEHADTDYILREQVKTAFKGVKAKYVSKVILAYEPIWAIGTGKSAPSNLADQKCGLIRKIIGDLYSSKEAEEIRICYGGSVNPSNCYELLSKPNIDGALVGGAALDPNKFITMCNETLRALNDSKK